MSTQRTNSAPPDYADWNPHFTPAWLSEKLASYISTRFTGAIIDPACGAGNLLTAAAVRTRAAERSAGAIRLLGIDKSKRAAAECVQRLSSWLPSHAYRVENRDFLRSSTPHVRYADATVIMNPPFGGYGELAPSLRRRVSRLFKMKGRFNLAYAFVRQALAVYEPRLLVSVLPSTWVHSRASAFREELDELKGSWDWIDIGHEAFERVNTHVGLLRWTPVRSKRRETPRTQHHRALGDVPGVEVHHGVATGADAVFIQLAELKFRGGHRMQAVRGRDVGRDSGSVIWVPPRSITRDHEIAFSRLAPSVRARLKDRTCVSDRGKGVLEYHDTLPAWFRGQPKLLVPEIATGSIRVELDTMGSRLPLHSALAIRVPNAAAGRRLRAHLMADKQQRRLLASAPRLTGGSVRIDSSAIRQLPAPRGFLSPRRRSRR